jgi:hypothetical protein
MMRATDSATRRKITPLSPMQGSATESTSGRAERSVEKLFLAVSSCQSGTATDQSKVPRMPGLALRVAIIRRVTSHIKNSNETTPMASKEKIPAALTCCCLTAIEAAANAMLMVTFDDIPSLSLARCNEPSVVVQAWSHDSDRANLNRLVRWLRVTRPRRTQCERRHHPVALADLNNYRRRRGS